MTTTFLNVSGQTLSVNYGLATPQTIASPGVLIVPDAVALNYSGDVAAWATIPNGATGAPAWSNATTYGAGYAALGSDSNTYQSIAAGNVGHDPTLDLSHTYWRLVPATGVVISSPIVYPAAGTVLTADGAGNSLFQPAAGAVTKAAVIATGLAATDIGGVTPPVIAQAASAFVSTTGSDSNDGRTWGTAHATIPHAIAALPANGGTVELGYGQINVASTGRIDSTVTFNGTTTVADTAAVSGDVGSYVVSSWLQIAAKIVSVTPGTGFVMDGAAAGSATVPALITKPAIELPAGVKLRGRGSSMSQSALISHALLPAITEIVDSGTGITVMPQNAAIFFSGLGYYLEDLSITGNANNIFGTYCNDATYVTCTNVDFRKHGIAGVAGTLNENELIFRGCRFTQNGSQAATKLTGGVLLNTPATVASAAVDFEDCFWLDNWGYGVAAGAGPASADQSAYGAKAVSFRACEWAYGRKTANPYSGVHINAGPALEGTFTLLDSWLESADVVGLVHTGTGPVTVIGTMLNAAGGGFNGVNSYGAQVAASGGLNLVGCTFQNATVASVENFFGAPVNWMGCWSNDPAFVVDSGGHTLVAASAATGSGAFPSQPSSVLRPTGITWESCPRTTPFFGVTALLSGQMLMQAVYLPAGVSIAKLAAAVSTAGATQTHAFLALYSPTFALLGQTADQTSTAPTQNALWTLNLSAPITTTVAGVHYIGVMQVAGTMGGLQSSTPSTLGESTGPPYLHGADTTHTGLTTTAPATATLTQTANQIYVAAG